MGLLESRGGYCGLYIIINYQKCFLILKAVFGKWALGMKLDFESSAFTNQLFHQHKNCSLTSRQRILPELHIHVHNDKKYQPLQEPIILNIHVFTNLTKSKFERTVQVISICV